MHARNSLDHGYDPVESIRQMYRMVRPGGYVYLNHVINEGVKQLYLGFHQWNFEPRGRDLAVWNKTSLRFLRQELPPVQEFRMTTTTDGWCIVTFRKPAR